MPDTVQTLAPLHVLVLGAGNSSALHVTPDGTTDRERTAVRLDIDPGCVPDVTFDLVRLHDGERLPFDDAAFDEIHAYEILEHYGRLGDWRGFFREWSEFYRVLKPGGHFCGSVPWWRSAWAFGDPGHCRVIQPEMFVFLSQDEYARQVGKTPMTDYRDVWQGDFVLRATNLTSGGVPPGDRMFFILQRGS